MMQEKNDSTLLNTPKQLDVHFSERQDLSIRIFTSLLKCVLLVSVSFIFVLQNKLKF